MNKPLLALAMFLVACIIVGPLNFLGAILTIVGVMAAAFFGVLAALKYWSTLDE
ncbi:MAG: hypothetical protein JKY94_17680 [Rhodobacteraceae bacterium]|nr:hypothetical protein [Paracoccaceae bacterium]